MVEQGGYLDSEKQLIIGAKVNRLCGAVIGKDTFDPQIHVADAQDIVDSLDSRIAYSSNRSNAWYYRENSRSRVKSGQTNLGQVDISFDEKKVVVETEGLNEYRVGSFVLTKLRNYAMGFDVIVFEHFLDRSAVEGPLVGFPDHAVIVFKRKDKSVCAITKSIPDVTFKNKNFPMKYEDYNVFYAASPKPIWQSDDFQESRLAEERRALLMTNLKGVSVGLVGGFVITGVLTNFRLVHEIVKFVQEK